MRDIGVRELLVGVLLVVKAGAYSVSKENTTVNVGLHADSGAERVSRDQTLE